MPTVADRFSEEDWEFFRWLLKREGSNTKFVQDFFYKAVKVYIERFENLRGEFVKQWDGSTHDDHHIFEELISSTTTTHTEIKRKVTKKKK